MTTRTFRMTEVQQQAPQHAQSLLAGLAPARLADLVYGMWAIAPDMLAELQAIYETHMRGEKIDLAGVEARLGRPLANEQRGYTVHNGVAVLPIEGVLAPKANLFMKVSGGASVQMLTAEAYAAGADPAVKSVMAYVDTPGGNVLGLPEFARALREVAAAKPVVTFTDGQMASGGVWVGVSGNHVYGSGSMVEVGHIGVLMTHRDQSVAEEKLGIKTTHITAGKYKALGSPHKPLSKADREVLQDRADYVYTLFANHVAEARGVSVEHVLEHMADARVFRGQQAVDAGLLDGLVGFDALLEQMATDPDKFKKRRVARIAALHSAPPSPPPKQASAGAAHAGNPSTSAGADNMDTTTTTPPAAPALTMESLQRDHSALYAQVLAAGALAERNRQADVRAQLLPGHEALIERMAGDGTTTGAQAAMAVLKAEKDTHAAAAAAHANDAPPAVAGSNPPADKPTKTREQMATECEAYAKEHKVSIAAAYKALGFS